MGDEYILDLQSKLINRSKPRKLERHIEEEMGDEYILDLQSKLINRSKPL